MPSWLAGQEVAAISAAVAVLALFVSVHAEARIRRLHGLSFPGALARLSARHDRHDVIKHDDHASPPCPAPIVAVNVTIGDGASEFQIAAVRLRWRDYGLGGPAFYDTDGYPPRAWTRRYRTLTIPAARRAASAMVYLDASNVAGPPRYLRVKVERAGGTQSSCWQVVPIQKSTMAALADAVDPGRKG